MALNSSLWSRFPIGEFHHRLVLFGRLLSEQEAGMEKVYTHREPRGICVPSASGSRAPRSLCVHVPKDDNGDVPERSSPSTFLCLPGTPTLLSVPLYLLNEITFHCLCLYNLWTKDFHTHLAQGRVIGTDSTTGQEPLTNCFMPNSPSLRHTQD